MESWITMGSRLYAYQSGLIFVNNNDVRP